MNFWQLLFIAVACVGCYSIGHHNGWNKGFDTAELIWKKYALQVDDIWKRAMGRVTDVISGIGDKFEGPK